MLNLLLVRKCLCLQLPLEQAFPPCSLLSWFRSSVLPQGGPSQCGSETQAGAQPPASSALRCPGVLGEENLPLSPDVHYSAFLSTCSKNAALFLGHGPCVQPHRLARAHVPAPALSQWNSGTRYLCKVTAFRDLVAFRTWAVSWVFLKWMWRLGPLDLRDFVGFSGLTD